MTEAAVEIDVAVETQEALGTLQAEAAQAGCSLTLLTWQGPGGGWPACSLVGPTGAVRMLLSAWGYDDLLTEEA